MCNGEITDLKPGYMCLISAKEMYGSGTDNKFIAAYAAKDGIDLGKLLATGYNVIPTIL